MGLRMSCRQQLEELNKASGLEVNQPHGVQVEDLCGMGKGRQREMGLEEGQLSVAEMLFYWPSPRPGAAKSRHPQATTVSDACALGFSSIQGRWPCPVLRTEWPGMGSTRL